MFRPEVPTPSAVEHVQHHPSTMNSRTTMKYTLNRGPVNMFDVTHLGTEICELGDPIPHNTQQWSVLHLDIMIHATCVHVPVTTVWHQKYFQRM